MNRLILLFVLLIVLTAPAAMRAGDTGTYNILEYRVNLAPRSDGTVDMEYYQKWEVTGGHIPWITVGTANNNFKIVSSGGAVAHISSAGGGDWSGVRLDLDRDYRPGETFEVSFVLRQSRLFYADNNYYGLKFTPGWYDRATTGSLRISIKFFADLATVKADPKPGSISGDEMIWIKNNLDRGERFSISVSFPKNLFPREIQEGNLKKEGTPPSQILVIVIASILTIFFVVLRVIIAMKRLGYSGGGIFYGGFPGGFSGRGGGKGGGRSSGGGGGFGGSSVSCACACVSCACACACAGGGGAGCSRKLAHTCPICKPRRVV